MTISIENEMVMPAAEAKERYRAYMAALRQRDNSEYREVARLYREVAKGKPIINAAQTIVKAGVFPDSKMPKLAITRADYRFVLWSYWEGRFYGLRNKERGWRKTFCHNANFTLPETPGFRDARQDGVAVVPLIPPEHAPPQGKESDFWILWEAEWQAAPRDPLLLKRIHGPLFAVIAHWDLTEVERAVLAGRV